VAEPRQVSLPGGVVVEIRDPRHQQLIWLRGKYYEPKMLEYIRAHYQGGVFIDGGACIGNHTLFFARFCANYVIAIEPEPGNIARLRRNLELSKLSHKVAVIPAAISDKPGRGALRRAGFKKSTGTFELIDGDDVPVLTLDNILYTANIGFLPVTLLKLDVQGSEMAALRGARGLLERHRPALFIELMTAAEIALADSFLREFGYKRGRCFNVSPTYEYTHTGEDYAR